MAEITLTARGPAGANGLNLYTETRNPLPEDGRDNESWLNTRSLTLFKKQAGIWGSIASLAPAAPKPGTPGASGKTIYSDEGPPATELGTSGDFYVQKSAGIGIVMYGPKAGSVWGDPVALVTMIVGTGAPPNTTGVNGQVFVDVAGSTFYGPKANGAWPTGVSLVGLLTGAGAPDPALGVDGQAYLDTQNAVLYAKKAGGLWAATGTTLRGLLTGSGAPGNALGFDGQTYVDTAALAFYGPKANGAWPAPTPLVGVITGSGAPANGLGLNGQTYIDVVGFKIYGPKAGGAWPAGASFLGRTPFKGLAPWVTGTAYVPGPPGDYVSFAGSSYVCLVGHTAGAFADDLAAGRWGPVAMKGADGTGSGTVKHQGAPTPGNLSRFTDGTGDLIDDAGVSAADIVAAADALARRLFYHNVRGLR